MPCGLAQISRAASSGGKRGNRDHGDYLRRASELGLSRPDKLSRQRPAADRHRPEPVVLVQRRAGDGAGQRADGAAGSRLGVAAGATGNAEVQQHAVVDLRRGPDGLSAGPHGADQSRLHAVSRRQQPAICLVGRVAHRLGDGRPDQFPHAVRQLPPQGPGRAGQRRHLLAGQSQPARHADLARRQGRDVRHRRLRVASRRRPGRDGRRPAPGRAEPRQLAAQGGPDLSQRSRRHLQLPVQFGNDARLVEGGRDCADRADRTQHGHGGRGFAAQDLRATGGRIQTEPPRRPPRPARHLRERGARRCCERQQRRTLARREHRHDGQSDLDRHPLCRVGRRAGRALRRLHGLPGRHLGRDEQPGGGQLVVPRLSAHRAGLAVRLRLSRTLRRRGAAQHHDGQCRGRRRVGRPVRQRPDQRRHDARQSLLHRRRRLVAQQPAGGDRRSDLAGHRQERDGRQPADDLEPGRGRPEASAHGRYAHHERAADRDRLEQLLRLRQGHRRPVQQRRRFPAELRRRGRRRSQPAAALVPDRLRPSSGDLGSVGAARTRRAGRGRTRGRQFALHRDGQRHVGNGERGGHQRRRADVVGPGGAVRRRLSRSGPAAPRLHERSALHRRGDRAGLVQRRHARQQHLLVPLRRALSDALGQRQHRDRQRDADRLGLRGRHRLRSRDRAGHAQRPAAGAR